MSPSQTQLKRWRLELDLVISPTRNGRLSWAAGSTPSPHSEAPHLDPSSSESLGQFCDANNHHDNTAVHEYWVLSK